MNHTDPESFIGKIVRLERTRPPSGSVREYRDVLEGVVKGAYLGATGALFLSFEEDSERGAPHWPASSTEELHVELTVIGHKVGTVALVDLRKPNGATGALRGPGEFAMRDVVCVRLEDSWLPVNQSQLTGILSTYSYDDELVDNVRPFGMMP